jgi:DNA-binding transcriptional MerR regulator
VLSIGEFARRGGVTIRMLRHYHKIGLLLPAGVDSANGYRLYEEVQLGALSNIVILKDLGFTLTEVRRLIHDVSHDELLALLRLRRTDFVSQLEQTNARLVLIERHIADLEEEDPIEAGEIGLRPMPDVHAVAASAEAAPVERLGPVLDELWALITRRMTGARMRPTGRAFVFSTEGRVHAAVPVRRSVEEPPRGLCLVDLPPFPTAATTVWRGAMDARFPKVYVQMADWIDANELEALDGRRDVFLDPLPEDGLVAMRIEWPVRARGESTEGPRPVFLVEEDSRAR